MYFEIHSNISRIIFWNTQQHLKEDILFFSRYLVFFSLIVFFLLSLFKLSCTKKYHVFNLNCILYTFSFRYVMYYIMSEICIIGLFSENCFYSYSQQNISAVANESLIPYNLTKTAPETQSTFNWYCNTECHPKLNQKKYEIQLSFLNKRFCSTQM